MAAAENNIVNEIEKLKWLRIVALLVSFVAGIGLVYAGWPRVAIFGVGGVIVLCGIGHSFAKKALIRAASLRTGKSVEELTQEVRLAERRPKRLS